MTRSVVTCAACSRRAVQFLRNGLNANAVALRSQSIRQFSLETSIGAPRSLDNLPLDSTIAEKKARERLERIVYKHLDRMDDPWTIGMYVEKALARNAFDEALLLVQKASRGKQVVVAWNHLIDYQLKMDRIKEAIKLFNEMKKRQQLPNDRTFTVLFRGLAKSQNSKKAVAEAIKYYNLLLSDKRLESNAFHLNAVLNVCARANDLDSMFSIADTINDSTRSPTAYTYTTILNALRHSATRDMDGLSLQEQTAKVEKVIEHAKGLWVEIMDKWSQHKLGIDEELVCAMGRVYLMAPKSEDKGEVLNILQQAMNIPNLVKNPQTDAYADKRMQNIASQKSSKPIKAPRRLVYAVPGTNTLALLLTALAANRWTTSGIKYWNLMVRHYGVVPDNNNWLRLFTMLKAAKASNHAAVILDAVPKKFLGPRHFQMAMETCIRDNINRNAVKNSTKVLDVMLEKMKVPDIHTLRLHLRVALVSHTSFRSMAHTGKAEEGRRLYGLQITEALARLWEPYRLISYHYFQTDNPKTREEEETAYSNKVEVVALARHMYSAFNKVINEKLLPEDEMRDVRKTTAQVNREIQSFYSSQGAHRPINSTNVVKQTEAEDELSLEDQDGFGSGRQGADWVWNTLKDTKSLQPVRAA